MSFKLDMQTKQTIKKLGKRGNKLQIVAAQTLNESAEELEKTYKKKLQRNQRIRTKFTLKSTRTFKARPIRSTGEPRPLGKINAITGVRKMKGGKKHYLAKLEDGRTQRGNSKTKNRVPIPLDTARIGQNKNRAISSPNRLLKGQTQTLRAGGKAFGIKGDGFKTSGQRFATLYRYKRRGGNLTGDLKKPFFFIDNSNKLGIFKFIGGRARKLRDLEKSTVRTKASPNFKKAVKATTPQSIKERFIKNAKKALGK